MSADSYVFTSESVSMGHPDKIADQVSDAVLDAMLAVDPKARVACETMVTTGMVQGICRYPKRCQANRNRYRL